MRPVPKSLSETAGLSCIVTRISFRCAHLYVFFTVFAAALFCYAGDAHATDLIMGTIGIVVSEVGDTLGTAIMNVVDSLHRVPSLFAGLAHLFGIGLAAWGINDVVTHVNNPNQVSAWEPAKKFLSGGAFFSLPYVAEVVRDTVGGDIESVSNSAFAADPTGGIVTSVISLLSGGGGAGLDTLLLRFISDIFDPMMIAISTFSYLAGVVFVMIGINRLLKKADEGARGPGGFGTIMTFLVGGALLSIDQMLGAFSDSIFGDTEVSTFAIMPYLTVTGMSLLEQAHIYQVLSSVVAFMMIIGAISFVRGWFILRDVAEGSQQASMMAGVTHLVGGAVAVNIGPLLTFVQNTLGLTQYGVFFV